MRAFDPDSPGAAKAREMLRDVWPMHADGPRCLLCREHATHRHAGFTWVCDLHCAPIVYCEREDETA
jgi:ribosomal protein L37AE/L43A